MKILIVEDEELAAQHISDLYFPFYMDFQTLSEILTK